MTETVTLDTFVRAETARMLHDLQAGAGGPGRWQHLRQPTPLDKQTVVRMNRDTLYSFAVLDLDAGMDLVIPDAGDRYVSVMAVTEEHHINRVFHDAGIYALNAGELGSRHVALAVRVLADPDDEADLAIAHAVQDGFQLHGGPGEAFPPPEYDAAAFDALRAAVSALGAYGFDSRRAFGSREQVDPVQHLVGTAIGWGGLPEAEAVYELATSGLPQGHYTIRVTDVPVDGFWSLSVYDGRGFFAPNGLGRYSVNSVTAERDADGAVTINLGGDPALPNCVPLPDGWNTTVRLYRPRPDAIDGRWRFPSPQPA